MLYVGESKDLGKRLRQHAAGFREARVSWCVLSDLKVKCQRLELENDLIGAYWQGSAV